MLSILLIKYMPEYICNAESSPACLLFISGAVDETATRKRTRAASAANQMLLGLLWLEEAIRLLFYRWSEEMSWVDRIKFWITAGWLLVVWTARWWCCEPQPFPYLQPLFLLRGSEVISYSGFDIQISSLIDSRLQVWDSWKRWISDHEKPQHGDHNEKGVLRSM